QDHYLVPGTVNPASALDSGQTSAWAMCGNSSVVGKALETTTAGQLVRIVLAGSYLTGSQVCSAALPNPTISAKGGVQSKNCTGPGHIVSINADSTVTCSADQGGITDPGSNGLLTRTATNTVTAANLTAHGVLVGNGVGTPAATSSGTTGQVLT